MHKVLPSITSYYKACTKYFPVLLRTTKLAQSTSQYYFVLESLHKVLPSTTSYYKACTKYFPVLLRTTKLAQSTSQYYFVLQSLHKVLPSTTSYYKACTKHFPVLLRTTKLAHSTPQYYFVLQSLHKVLPSTTTYYKACTKYFPVLLRTTKLAQSTSQYYFVLQSLHKVLPSTTSYYKACTKYFPVPLRTTKLAQSTSQYYFVLQSRTKYFPVLLRTTKLAQSTPQYYFVLQSLHKVLPSTTSYYKACTKYFQYYFVLQSLQKYFTVLLRTTKDNFSTVDDVQMQRTIVLSEQPWRQASLMQRLNCKTQDRTCAKQPWCSHHNAICRDWVAKHKKKTRRNGVRNCSSKTGSRGHSSKKHDFEALFTKSFTMKITSAKIRKIRWQITLADMMQPFQNNLRCPAAKDKSITHAAVAPSNFDAAITLWSADFELQNTTELRAKVLEIAAPKPDLDAKKTKTRFWSTFSKEFEKENQQRQNWKNPLTNHSRRHDVAIPKQFTMSSCKRQEYYARSRSAKQPSCSHYTAICHQRFKKHIELRTDEQPLVAEHRGGTDSRPVRAQLHPSHTGGTFHRRPELHGKTQGFLPRLSPTTRPMQHAYSHYNAFCNIRFQTRISRRTSTFMEYSLTLLIVM